MYGYDESGDFERPKIFSGRTLCLSLLLHLAFFAVLWTFAVLHGLFTPKETIIPIDLTVVVNENLNGKENEPPPLKNPEPPPPKAQPKPKPKPKPVEVTPPKPLEQMEIDKVKVKPKPEPKVKPKTEPKVKPKEEVKPKTEPTKKPSLEERLRKMRESAVKNTKPVKIQVDKAKPSGNGRTECQTRSADEIRKLLDAGYKPGTKTQLATSDLQLGVSLVKMALEEKWEKVQPKVGRSGTVVLSCRLNSSGGLIQVRIERTCGDALSDQAVLSVARQISSIASLPEKFVSQFMRETLTIRYEVQGR